MRRTLLACVLVASCLPFLVSASAGTYWTTRQSTANYSYPVGATSASSSEVRRGPVFQVSSAEQQFRVWILDNTHRSVAADVTYTHPDGSVRHYPVCNSMPNPIYVKQGSTITVTPVSGPCGNGQVSAPTSGRIDVQFYTPHPTTSTTPGHYASPANRWAVVIGITKYSGYTHPTYGGVGDAYAVRDSLLHAGWYPNHILMLLDSKATGANIGGAMKWLAGHSSSVTFSLFHYSGHVCISSRGPCAYGHTYLWSYDNQFIPETSVGALLGAVRGYAWFDFSGCESGAFNYHLSNAYRLVSAASQAHETAYEDPNHSESIWTETVWTQAFAQGQAGGHPYRASIRQMLGYGNYWAPRMTQSQPTGSQHPYVAGGGGGWLLWAPPVA